MPLALPNHRSPAWYWEIREDSCRFVVPAVALSDRDYFEVSSWWFFVTFVGERS